MTGPIPPKDAKPGSLHWLIGPRGGKHVLRWTGERSYFLLGEARARLLGELVNWTYVGPALPPPDNTASVTEVTEEMVEAACAGYHNDPDAGDWWPRDFEEHYGAEQMALERIMMRRATTAALSLHPASPAVERERVPTPQQYAEFLGELNRIEKVAREGGYNGRTTESSLVVLGWANSVISQQISERGETVDAAGLKPATIAGSSPAAPTNTDSATLPHPAPPVPVSGDGEAS